MLTPKSLLILITVLIASNGLQAQQSQVPQPQPTQTKPQPCGAAPTSSVPRIKVPPKWRAKFDQISPISSSDLASMGGANPVKTAIPCPPPTPNTQLAPVLHIPVGVVTTWLCNPIVTSTDASHTTTFVTPDALTTGEPAQPNTFEADGAKADLKAAASCANLRRDPKTNRVFLVQ